MGLTKIYGLVNDPSAEDEDVLALREAHVRLDHQVLSDYGWSDIDLSPGFVETANGVRFAWDARATSEVLDRMLALNHQRHHDEMEAGLVGRDGKPIRKGTTAGRPAKATPLKTQIDMFGSEES